MTIAIQGLLAGAAHVLSGPDHLVGVAPLAVDRRRRIRPAVVGATWGLGHGLGVALLGLLGQTLLSAADVSVASGWAERLVGVVLIVLGINAVRRARTLVVHEHRHGHDGQDHVHLHVHTHEGEHAAHAVHAEAGVHRHNHAAFGMGLVHGLAGAGHFWAALPSLAMEPAEAAVYIGSYVAASLALMTAFGAVLGWCARSVGVAWLPRLLTVVGVLTVAIGAWWLATASGLL
ncbi:MAG: hydantoin utilization protein A [Planctomycetota bacterium]